MRRVVELSGSGSGAHRGLPVILEWLESRVMFDAWRGGSSNVWSLPANWGDISG